MINYAIWIKDQKMYFGKQLNSESLEKAQFFDDKSIAEEIAKRYKYDYEIKKIRIELVE